MGGYSRRSGQSNTLDIDRAQKGSKFLGEDFPRVSGCDSDVTAVS